jgi:hypothetical protein
VHKIKINVVGAQRLQRGVNAFLNPLVPRVIELGGQPNLFSGNARILNSSANFFLIAICKLMVN